MCWNKEASAVFTVVGFLLTYYHYKKGVLSPSCMASVRGSHSLLCHAHACFSCCWLFLFSFQSLFSCSCFLVSLFVVPVFSLPAVLMRVPVPVLVLGILWSCLCCSWCGRFLVLCRVVGALDVAVVLLCSIPCCLLCCPHALL